VKSIGYYDEITCTNWTQPKKLGSSRRARFELAGFGQRGISRCTTRIQAKDPALRRITKARRAYGISTLCQHYDSGTRNLLAEIGGAAAIVNRGLRVKRVTINNLSSVYSKITEEIVNIPEEEFSSQIER
jgi:hypothetical protein